MVVDGASFLDAIFASAVQDRGRPLRVPPEVRAPSMAIGNELGRVVVAVALEVAEAVAEAEAEAVAEVDAEVEAEG